MASQLINQRLIKYLTTALVGILSFLAFAPYDQKWILVLSYLYLVSILTSSSTENKWLHILLWGFGLWFAGTFWLIVSIHYHGNVNIALSVTALIFLGFLLSSIFVLPIMLFIYIKRISNFTNALILSSILILLESARFFILGGFPWLQPGVIFLDTILDFLIPIIGVIGCSLLFYLIVSAAALSSKKAYKYGLSILLIIAFAIPSLTTKLDIHNSSDEHLKFGIVQPSFGPRQKFESDYGKSIEDRLISLSLEKDGLDLIVWPESPFPYTQKSSYGNNLVRRLEENNLNVISGIYQSESAPTSINYFNTLTILSSEKLSGYKKVNLVPFGEFLPFESILRGLIDFFDLPMSFLKPGNITDETIPFRNHSILPLICFDTAYINNYIQKVKNSTIVVNVSNDSWFGESNGPHQHFQIVRSRAKEINRWILRSTASGISGFIDNKGTVVDKMEINEQGIISFNVPQTTNNSLFVNFGYDLMRYLIICCSFFIIILFLRKVLNENS